MASLTVVLGVERQSRALPVAPDTGRQQQRAVGVSPAVAIAYTIF